MYAMLSDGQTNPQLWG